MVDKWNNPFKVWNNPAEEHADILLKPNSGHWKIYKEGKYCTLQQAVLLSLDIEPDWYLDRNGQENHIFNMLKWAEYRARLKTAKSLGKTKALWVAEPDKPLEEEGLVDLILLAKIFIDLKYELPKEFMDLVEGDKKPKVHDRKWADEKTLLKAFSKALNKHKSKSKSLSKKELMNALTDSMIEEYQAMLEAGKITFVPSAGTIIDNPIFSAAWKEQTAHLQFKPRDGVKDHYRIDISKDSTKKGK